jgi:putative SOS response-associated peptidase YedK
MCGRFTQHYSWQEIRDFLDLFGEPRNLRPRYNVAPSTMVDVVRLNAEGRREMTSMRWGFIPSWWKKPLSQLGDSHNAQVERVAVSPFYRDAYKKRRCIVPVSGWYEWTGPKKERKPHMFSALDDAPVVALAGLWESWRNPETGEDVLSCTIITTKANEWMKPYHHRMPAALQQANIDRWLRGEMTAEELYPAPEAKFKERKVSSRINNSRVGDDDPTVLEFDELDI